MTLVKYLLFLFNFIFWVSGGTKRIGEEEGACYFAFAVVGNRPRCGGYGDPDQVQPVHQLSRRRLPVGAHCAHRVRLRHHTARLFRLLRRHPRELLHDDDRERFLAGGRYLCLFVSRPPLPRGR